MVQGADRLTKHEVAESGVEFLLMQATEYVLHHRMKGAGGEVDDSPEAAHEARSRMEALGFDVGQRLIERVAMDVPRLDGDLEIIKYVCKEFWEAVFKKQVDALKTNHKGLFVLQDNAFRWMRYVAESGSLRKGTVDDYALFPGGLVWGALQRLGLRCTVTVDVSRPPKALFSVQVHTSVEQ